MTREHGTDQDLQDHLRTERPRLAPFELDQLKQTVLSRTSSRPSPRKAGFLKSRLALTAVVATGLVMSSTGATLAVTGIAGDGNAAQSQYVPPGSTPPGQGGVQGDQQQGGSGPGSNGNGSENPGQGNVLGEQKRSSNPGATGTPGSASTTARAGDQVAAGTASHRLPFTGFVVFPLLIGGLILLAGGLGLRRRSTLE